ncbi:MAG: DeoR/GlpR transcriptional regulator [Lachnospiraceae bacterium]|nr:DeoR/GlpR transcriptional regulator [Lachnospiraceae bacterium]
MADNKLKIDVRRRKILETLRRDGKVLVSDLSRDLGVTLVTVRNDLDALEQDGYLERMQGGAILKTPVVMSGWGNCSAEKQAIAEAAARQIEDGSTLFVNSGTTTHCLAVALKNHKNLNVVTNSLTIAMELGGVPSIHALLLGGEINPQHAFTFGGDAQEQLRHYQADWAVMSVDGISALAGATSFHPDEAVVNRIMIERAKNILIVADHTKIGRAGFAHLCDVRPSVHLITDEKCNRAEVTAMEQLGLEVIIV